MVQDIVSSYIHINIINLADPWSKALQGNNTCKCYQVHIVRLCVHEMVNLKICFGMHAFAWNKGFGFVFSALMLFLCFIMTEKPWATDHVKDHWH